MSSKGIAEGYRRNGKRKSCEPCRKGKLACDHGAPFCGRCVRRKMTEKCIYHPAPMTKVQPPGQIRSMGSNERKSQSQMSSETSSTMGHIPNQQKAQLQNISPNPNPAFFPQEASLTSANGLVLSCDPASESSSRESELRTPRHPKGDWKSAVFQKSAVFHGPTSFSAIFAEHQNKLEESLLDIGEDVRSHPGAWRFLCEPLLGRLRPNGPTARTRQTVLAMQNIPPLYVCQALLAGFENIRGSILDPTIVKYCVESLYTVFGPEMVYPRTEETILPFVETLFDNEEVPLPPSPDDGFEWLDTFTGKNVRFEMMGLMFCYFGMAYLTLQDWDPLFAAPENHGHDRKQTAWRMKECAEVCLQMCDYAETVNFLIPALIINLKRLETGCTGDETYHIRRLHGDVVTTTITSGLHRLPNYTNAPITAASEFKRQLFCSVYINDKTHASLNGTPPLLSRVYCEVQMCLDLPDGALFLPQAELAKLVSDLDENGWSRDPNAYYNTTVLRAKVQLSIIREDVLQLALGVNADRSIPRIHDLHRRCQEIYNSLPAQLHYYVRDKILKSTTGSALYDQAYVLLLYLQNTFSIDRVAISCGFSNEQGLFETALEMIEVCLHLWIKRDQLMSLCCNFDWIIMYYGIPSAGVICVELLKTSTGQSSIQFSRSDAIQKMTLFIAFLEWVRPTDGNYALAQRLRKVVRRVLDHVLDPLQNQPNPAPSTEMNVVEALQPSSFGETADLDWLNTIDWTQGSWMDFN